MQEDYVFEKDGHIYKLDGYNEQKKIGFSWLDYSNLNQTNYISHWENQITTLPSNPYKLTSIVETISYDYSRHKTESDELSIQLGSYQTQMKEIVEMKDKTIQKAAVQAFQYEYLTFLLSKNRLDYNFDLQEEAKAAFELPAEKQFDAFEKLFFKYEMSFFGASANNFSKLYTSYVLENLSKFDMPTIVRHHRN